MSRRPVVIIGLGDQDITSRFDGRIQRVTVTDASGEDSDTLEIELDDAGGAIELPRKGAVLGVSMGWEGEAVSFLGRFTVDELAWQIAPAVLIIRGKSADMRGAITALRSRTWRATTLGEIVSTIAAENGLDGACSADLGGRAVAHCDQARESDLHFLTRLGRQHGAVASAKNGKLVLIPESAGQSVSGQALDPVVISRRQMLSASGVLPDRGQFARVRARWRDMSAGETLYAEAGEGDPMTTLSRTYASEGEAQEAADAEFARVGRSKGSIEIEVEGRPEILAEAPITIEGVRTGADGAWTAKEVEHAIDLSSGGFTTRITAEAADESTSEAAS